MKANIFIYANKKSYIWRIITENYSKQVINYKSANERIRNEILAAIQAVEMLEAKSDITLISCRKSFKNLFNIYDKEIKNRKHIKENFELWNRLKYLVDQHLNYKYTQHIEKEEFESEMAKLHPQLQP